MTKGSWALFHMLLDILCSLVQNSYSAFCPFCSQLFDVFLLICRSSLCILYRSPLSDIGIVHIFSHFMIAFHSIGGFLWVSSWFLAATFVIPTPTGLYKMFVTWFKSQPLQRGLDHPGLSVWTNNTEHMWLLLSAATYLNMRGDEVKVSAYVSGLLFPGLKPLLTACCSSFQELNHNPNSSVPMSSF